MLGRKTLAESAANVLQVFLQSWDAIGTDEVTICSAMLDIFQSHLGERPCCVWKRVGASYDQISERDMIQADPSTPESAMAAGDLLNGHARFIPVPSKNGFSGFMYVPIRLNDEVFGLLALAVAEKEKSDAAFSVAVESAVKLLALALAHVTSRWSMQDRERRLQAEVGATTRELESTNKALIERVRELKNLYKELQKRVEELTNANRAKDEFLSIVSHELRTPLTSLTGFLAVLLDEEAGTINEQQRKFLGIAKQSAGRLNLIISDLLDISRIESGRLNLEMETCSLFEIVKTSVEGLQSSAVAKGLALRLSGSPQIPAIWGDASRLQQVADNLISNAIKFTDRDGEIDVAVEEKGDLIQVAVRDTGPGLSPEEQVKVFDMFYQADASARRSASGAGLGLAIARGIVTMHGGEIAVQSEKGKGSTFLFMVPRHKAQKAA